MTTPSHTETDPARGARGPIVIEDDLPVDHSSLPELDPDAYELMDEIARGGMGRILRARDRLGRIVAVKQLLDPSPHHIALFEREARITARLQHPSIVSVIEAGVLPDGQRVYVMKLVPGHSLKYELRKPTDVLERLRLLPIIIAIADALAYAHAQGVIHRDLKPSNILIGEFGEVVVIDWGLAHDPQTRGPSSPDGDALDGHSTITAKAMGTPAYMSPEAARSEPVDQRTDVYAIGAILYELLSGAAPYTGDGAGILAAVRASPPEPIARRVPGTPPDLAAIVDKAMAYDRAARYPSAKELAEELRRFATGQFVSAYAYSLRDRFARWLRRNRAPVAVAAAAFAIVTTLVAIGVTRIVHERDVAADRAERLTLARARLELDRDPAGALATLTELPPDSPAWSAARTIAADALARGVPNHVRFDGPIDALAMTGRAAPHRAGPRLVIRQDDAIEVVELESSDAGRVVTAGVIDATRKVGRDGARRDVAARTSVVARIAARASAVTLSTDGETVAAIEDGQVRVWRVASPGKPVFERAGPRLQVVIAVSADGAFVAAAGRDTGLSVWRIADGEELVRNEQLRDIAHLSASGVAVAAIDSRGHLTLASPTTSIVVGLTRAVAIHDQLAIATTPDGTLRVFDPVSFQERRSVALGLASSSIAISPAGTRIAIASESGIAVFDREGTRLRFTAARHRPRGVAVDDAGSVAVFERENAWWWSAASDRDRLATASTSAFAVAGDRVVSIGDDGAVWTWRLGGKPIRIGAHTAAARAVAIAPDGTYALTIGDDRAIRRWTLAENRDDSPRGTSSELLGVHHGPGLAIAIGANGAVASGGGDRLVHLWRAGKDSVLGRHAGAVHSVAFSPDGTQLASAGDDREVIVWSLANRAPRRFVHAAPVTAIAWLAGGALVVGARDGTVTWWSPTADGTRGGRILATHTGPVRSLATYGDDRIASGGDDGRVGVGTSTGLVLHPGHGDLVRRLAFAPSGVVLATASEDGSVRLWDFATGEGRAIALGGWLADVAFLGNDTCLAAGANGLWSIADGLPHDRDALRAVIGTRVDGAR